MMPIPDYQSLMLPVLKLLIGKEALASPAIIDSISNQFNLSQPERNELLPSGKQKIINNRIGWAKTYLKKANLVIYPQRGFVQLTDEGMSVLQNNPEKIDVDFLRQFPEFLDFRDSSSDIPKRTGFIDIAEATPEEQLYVTHAELKTQLLADLINNIKTCSPQFFEQLVVDVIVTMGYGGSREEAGQAVGQSGDEGIDGVINEDRLGLDVIYLQAKRWEASVGRPEIQKFAGALQGKRAKKGIFITTSDFTKGAKEYVEHIDCRIILLSGVQLAELMWEYNIGLHLAASYQIKKLDLDYFNEDID